MTRIEEQPRQKQIATANRWEKPYTLTDNERFAAGMVYGPDKQLRFKSNYQCEEMGRLKQELQSDLRSPEIPV